MRLKFLQLRRKIRHRQIRQPPAQTEPTRALARAAVQIHPLRLVAELCADAKSRVIDRQWTNPTYCADSFFDKPVELIKIRSAFKMSLPKALAAVQKYGTCQAALMIVPLVVGPRRQTGSLDGAA